MPSTFSTSDLTPLLQAAPTAQMRYASGVIVSWNAESYENVIEVRGSLLINLPVLSGPDGLSYKAGDVVALIGADQQGARGIASYAILGRFLVPGAGRAEQSIEWMTSELGRSIAASVFADRVKSDFKNLQVSNTSENTWQDAEFAGSVDPGPTVEIEITERGAAIVIVGASMGAQESAHGRMSFEISGATDRVPSPSNAASFYNYADAPAVAGTTSTAATHITDLNPGVHKFEAKYWALFGDNGVKPHFANRSLTVIGF